MYILPQERPQNVEYRFMDFYDGEDNFYHIDTLPLCIKCKHSEQNMSYPKDEMDCKKTGGICNALCTCNCFEENC